MAKNFKRKGETIDFVASANTTAGSLVLVGTIAAVALSDVANGEAGVGHTEGVWELPAVSAATAVAGAAAYVTSGGNVTGTATDNTLIGVFWEAKTNGQTTALVKLNA